jgi:hypothetical protein
MESWGSRKYADLIGNLYGSGDGKNWGRREEKGSQIM